MSLNLPEPVAAYFAADLSYADCFAEDAVVRDEGNTHNGRAAILQWRAESARRFSYTSQPFAVEKAGEKWLVSSRVSGDFPGSPVELEYAFRLSDQQIVELTIS